MATTSLVGCGRPVSGRFGQSPSSGRRSAAIVPTPLANIAASRVAKGARNVSVAAEDEPPAATYAQLESITCDLSSFPDCSFFRVEAIVRPWRMDDVVSGLAGVGIKGFTVTDVSGVGAQGIAKERYAGTEFGSANLIEKVKIEAVCVREQVDVIVQQICTSAFTGEQGDGKIFVHPVADIVRIRTAETGINAERMTGGMSDRTVDASA